MDNIITSKNNEIVDIFSDNKSDEGFRNIILDIHNFIQSSPFPYEWLKDKCEMYNTNETDFGKTVWGKELIKYARNEIAGCLEELETIADDLQNNIEAQNYLLTIQDDILILKSLRINNVSWDDFYECISKIKFSTLKRAPKLDEETAEEVKSIRNKMKDKIQKFLRDEIFISSSEEIFDDIHKIYSNLKSISDVVIRFDKKFKEKKRAKNLIDFSDMEHICLELLSNNENVADMYKNQFDEILVDEYQDSNLIQEYILNKISKGNIFMVGDVKQSIYRFRQARPDLFLEKYNSYTMADDDVLSEGKKILLFKNFRSNENIINQCNFIFKNTMSKDVGEIDYNEGENIPESEQKELNEIDIDEYLKLKKGSSKSVIFIARPGCSWCQLYTPIMKNVVYLYDIKVNHLNTDKLTIDGVTKLLESDDYFSEGYGTPLTLIVQNNKIVDMIEGYTSKENTIQFFKDNGIIKE